MPTYDYAALVSVPGPTLTTFRTELTNAAATAGPTFNDAFTKLANVALPTDNRFLAATREVRDLAEAQGYTALFNAAVAVLAQATGLP